MSLNYDFNAGLLLYNWLFLQCYISTLKDSEYFISHWWLGIGGRIIFAHIGLCVKTLNMSFILCIFCRYRLKWRDIQDQNFFQCLCRRLPFQCLITWAFHLCDVKENIISDNSRIVHKWSHNLGSCLALEKTVANIITSLIRSIFHHAVWIWGLFWQILILSEEKYHRIKEVTQICSIRSY